MFFFDTPLSPLKNRPSLIARRFFFCILLIPLKNRSNPIPRRFFNTPRIPLKIDQNPVQQRFFLSRFEPQEFICILCTPLIPLTNRSNPIPRLFFYTPWIPLKIDINSVQQRFFQDLNPKNSYEFCAPLRPFKNRPSPIARLFFLFFKNTYCIWHNFTPRTSGYYSQSRWLLKNVISFFKNA